MSSTSSASRPANRTRIGKGQPACVRCHSLKIKCSGESPCRGCKHSLSKVDCVYPVKDRKIQVSEKYLKSLIAENSLLRAQTSSGPVVQVQLEAVVSEATGTPEPDDHADSNVANPIFDETVGFVDESDVSRRAYVGEAATTTFETRIRQMIGDQTPSTSTGSLYFKNKGLLRVGSSSYSLPSRTYAHLLVQTLLRFIGGNYHLMTEKSFCKKIDETYAGQHLEPVWLARLFVIFALGELYLNKTPMGNDGATVPGTHFFLQATSLFPDWYEEVDLQYIETLYEMALFSNALNRTRSAHAYLALAVRLGTTLGLHRNDMYDRRLNPVERERRHRIWWTIYTFDRLGCSKLGQPALIRDEDIDTPLPSTKGLTDLEKAEFQKPEGLKAKVKLAEITGAILDLVYRASRERTQDHFVRNVHLILARLRTWDKDLPSQLRLKHSGSPCFSSRPVASLRLHFNDCIVMTTRPVLLHVFKTHIRSFQNVDVAQRPQTHSPLTSSLSDACVQSSRSSIHLLAQLWVHGSLATFGYFDANYVFSSAIVLLISNFLTESEEDQDCLETAWDMLRMMKNEGNVPAADFTERLTRLKSNVEELKNSRFELADGFRGGVSQHTYQSAPKNAITHVSTEAVTDSAIPSSIQGPLDDPRLQGFLMQSDSQWNADILGSTEELPFPWMYDIDFANLFDANIPPAG